MEAQKESVQEPKEELNSVLEEAERSIDEVSNKFDEIAKDNEQLRSEMSEEEQRDLDKAKDILEAETSDDTKAQMRTMSEAAATALVRSTIRQFNLVHKVSRSFIGISEAHGLENFMREQMKNCKLSGKARAAKKRKLTIEYRVLRNGHIQFQEGVTLKNFTRIFFAGFKPCQSDAEFKDASAKAIEELRKISGKQNIEALLLNLRYCVKFPMNSLYGYFAMAIVKYCSKIGGFDSKQFVKSIVRNLTTIAIAAVATKGLGEAEVSKMDLSVIETFAQGVEAFDKKLSEFISEKKEG